jgi:hypothetical protein
MHTHAGFRGFGSKSSSLGANMTKTKRFIAYGLTGVLLAKLGLAATAQRPDRVEYNRDIRPILSNNCWKCHGPDDKTRQAGLRFDLRDDAVRPTKRGATPIVPGNSNQSELVKRVFSDDPDVRMPPHDSNKSLTDREKLLLRRWIDEGAEYQPHWSFIPVKRPAAPATADAAWSRNTIDPFIVARLQADGLRPAHEAEKTTLIRRVTFDLTGLPPTPDEVDAFLADDRPGAYERVVDRLLASPRYGERMAVDWLDAARFADTHGYHIDSGRDMSHWREWVIDAFNTNKPFDAFTVEQLAGDLLPDATISQRVASGFNRNHMINFEGGAIPDEYHTAYIVDRVNTTATVWLGLTLGCAQCHEHKYDPFTQKDYYRLFAFFYNVPENGLDGRAGNAAPLLKLPTPDQQRQLDQLSAAARDMEQRLAGPIAEVDAAQAEWERSLAGQSAVEWIVLDPHQFTSKGGATLAKLEDKSIRASGENPATEAYTVTADADVREITAVRLELLPDDSFTAKGPGRSVNGNVVLTDVRIALAPAAPHPESNRGAPAPVELKAASADFSQKDFPVALAIDDKPDTGWAIHPEVGKRHEAVFELSQPRPSDGKQTITVALGFHSSFARHQVGRFRLSVTNARSPHAAQKPPAKILEIIAVAADQRNDAQRSELRGFYRSNFSPVVKQINDELSERRQSLAEIEKKIANTMVMQEMPSPRDTFMLVRGQYDKKGEKVGAGVPTVLSPLPEGAPSNRLGLAQWLTNPAHPLTARVIVNRYWQAYFGAGLVKTAEDFGSQGEWPSHPELLDWLAAEFMESGRESAASDRPDAWNVKHIQRLIVTSATYRQSSAVTPELAGRDPENRLLARGPRVRLAAEFIRDQALAVSGLLNGEIGGQSVSPYQPPGLWEELMSRQDGKNWTAQEYSQSHGKDLYRRTMYTFWKRTCPPPTLAMFDAPDRETCTVRRARTNTPLQALILMNDPTYVEAARKLAERLIIEAASTDERVVLAFRLATGRKPRPNELAVLRALLSEQLDAYRRDPQAAAKLLAVGEYPRRESLDAAEVAAWTMIANVVLNLDEAVTKG